MSRQSHLKEEETLIACLREEARQTRPEFSPALHHRVWEACRRLRAAEASRPAHAARAWPLRLTWAAAAVAGVVLCAACVWYGVFVFRSGDSSLRLTAGLGEKSGLLQWTDSGYLGAEQIDRLAGAALASQEWTSLNHDVQLALDAFAQDFPLPKSRTAAALQLPGARD